MAFAILPVFKSLPPFSPSCHLFFTGDRAALRKAIWCGPAIVAWPGFRGSTHIKAIVGTDLCMHAHGGFLVRGQFHIQYADGCTLEFVAPQAVAIEPGHDGWVVGDEAAVLIECDFEKDSVSRLGMLESHQHG